MYCTYIFLKFKLIFVLLFTFRITRFVKANLISYSFAYFILYERTYIHSFITNDDKQQGSEDVKFRSKTIKSYS